MPELRRDPITRRWVIFPKESPFLLPRVKWESEFPEKSSACPFCPGKEGLTPPEILAYRDRGSYPNAPGWRVRVIPNSYPVLRVEEHLEREGLGPYDRMGAVGAHEVIIESPHHERDLGDLSDQEILEVLLCWRDRLLDLKRDKRLRSALVFRSRGLAAGARLSHPHSQIIALPVIPKALEEELSGARRYFEDRERCAYCDIVKEEIRERARIIQENGAAVALAPYASRRPFEVWVLPRQHEPSFEAGNEQSRYASVAEILGSTLRRLVRALEHPAYHLALHSAPYAQSDSPFYHWHIEILPALSPALGFEMISGCSINPTAPETAATFLREVAR